MRTNIKRFPKDFIFELTKEEFDSKIREVLTQLIKKQEEQKVLRASKTDGKIGFLK